ncbi:MAG: OmpA family protein [Chitinispirillia bacterium]|nr:OmpA family protein [Chitinispirillia bacterium]
MLKKASLLFTVIALLAATAIAQDPPPPGPVYVMEDFRSELVAVMFEDTGTALTPKSSAALDSVSAVVRRNKQHRYEVHGHTCAGAENTMRFSVQRVQAMINYLLASGVPTAKITTVVNPPADAGANGCTRDRRVEIMMIETRQVEVKPEPPAVAIPEPVAAPEPEPVLIPTAPPPESAPKLADAAAEQGKQAVAIYMAGDEPKGAQGVHNIMGGELARVISGSDKYLAVDRTEVILEQLAKEHTYQRSGAVDDDQIKALGQQLGVQYLCISGINPVGKRYYLDTRLVDVVTAEIMRSVTETSALRDAEDMSRIARSIALELIEPEATRNARLLRKKIFRYTAIGLDILGAGALAYGYLENSNVVKHIDKNDPQEAKRAETRRNAAYVAGGVILAGGITIHILF